MKVYTLKTDKEIIKFKVPIGMKDITYKQWDDTYKYMELAYQAEADFDKGDYDESLKKSVESICRTIAGLSEGITYEQLLNANMDKVMNLFKIDFDFLQREPIKKKFKIKGREIKLYDFNKRSAGDFMDAATLLQMAKEHDADIGLMIAAVYMDSKEYKQDEQQIKDNIAFLKEHGRMDLFRSASFFLLNFIRNLSELTQQHLGAVAEMERRTSILNVWAITLYSQALQKLKY